MHHNYSNACSLSAAEGGQKEHFPSVEILKPGELSLTPQRKTKRASQEYCSVWVGESYKSVVFLLNAIENDSPRVMCFFYFIFSTKTVEESLTAAPIAGGRASVSASNQM